MNPLIRILCLLVLAAMLPALSLPLLALLALLLVAAQAWAGSLPRLLQGVLRLRWLFLAIFVLYLGFTPGDPWLASLPGLSREGLYEGARRALVLFDLLAAVYLLLALTRLEALVQGLVQLLYPLRVFGFDPTVFARRLALAMDRVGALQAQVAAIRAHGRGWLDGAAALMRDLEQTSLVPASAARGAAPDSTLASTAASLPRWWEWPLPPLLALLLWKLPL
ncbi:MAG TPA: hypothetical protein VGE57_06195 [Solimonas sp.]